MVFVWRSSRAGLSRMSPRTSVCRLRDCVKVSVRPSKRVRQAEADECLRPGMATSEERVEIREPGRENAQLRRANEILKAASVFFAAWLDKRGHFVRPISSPAEIEATFTAAVKNGVLDRPVAGITRGRRLSSRSSAPPPPSARRRSRSAGLICPVGQRSRDGSRRAIEAPAVGDVLPR